MQEEANLAFSTPSGVPWKGKLIGAKPPLRQKHVWAIRGMLQNARNKRDLAMFNLGIDSKLRGCDVIAIKVDDVAPNGYAVDRATVRQTIPGKGWFVIFRLYGPLESWFNKTWRPGEIERQG